MRARVLTGFCLGAGVDVHPGDEIDFPDAHAAIYLQQGRIAPIPDLTPGRGETSPAAGAPTGEPSMPPPGHPLAATNLDPTATTRARGRGRG